MSAIPTSAFVETAPLNSYSASLRWLHWIMAAIIFTAIGLGVTAALSPRGALRSDLLFVHKSFGMTALILVVLRIVSRALAGAPPYDPPLKFATRIAAHGAHVLLYALMIAMPVSGYVFSNAVGSNASWFGLFAFPNVVPHDRALGEAFAWAHWVLAWAIGAVLALHLAAVAWHTLVRHDGVLRRMLPARR